MKLNEISLLNENQLKHQTELLKDSDSPNKQKQFILSTLHKNCKEVIEIYKDVNSKFIDSSKQTLDLSKLNVMFRGEGSFTTFFENNIRKNRKPLYLNKWIHDETIKIFEKLGLKSHRGNSIFCARLNTAAVWGSGIYIIFPKDGFNLTWFKSPNTGEYMYNNISESDVKFIVDVKKLINTDFQQSAYDDYDDYESKFKSYRFKIKTPGTDLNKEYLVYLENLIKKYEPVSGNLKDALLTKKNNEFLISGNGYYGLKCKSQIVTKSFFKDLINI